MAPTIAWMTPFDISSCVSHLEPDSFRTKSNLTSLTEHFSMSSSSLFLISELLLLLPFITTKDHG